MRYYYVELYGVIDKKIRGSGHLFRCKDSKEVHSIIMKYPNTFLQKRTFYKVFINKLDSRRKIDKALIERRKKGQGGSIWYEENNELKHIAHE